MITTLYAVFDDKAKVFNKPFHQINDAVAERTAQNLLTEQNEIAKNPSDFTMYKIGEYDDTTGLIESGVPELFLTFNQLGQPEQ